MAPPLASLKARLSQVGLDLRSLALLRITLGSITLLDLALRARDLTAHYTDFGVLPRTALIELAYEEFWFSIHMGSGTPLFQGLLFMLAAVATLSMTLGYRTRISTAISWFLLISLQARNPMILNSGDTLLRAVLFWCIFLPWGARWSVDSRSSEGWKEDTHLSAATVAYTVQVALLYLCASRLKSGMPWLDGSAVYYALSIDQFTTVLGHRLLEHPTLMTFLTYATVAVQTLLPVLILLPLATAPLRLLAVFLMMAFHLGIGLHMHIGIFTPVAALCGLGLLPGGVWDALLKRLPRAPLVAGGRLLDLLARRLPAGSSSPPLSRPVSILVCGMLIYVVCWNLATVDWLRYRLPPSWTHLGQAFRLDQHWGMFAPAPLVNDGWYVVPGHLKNGCVVDLFAGTNQVNWEKPPLVSATFPNERWRKYMMNLFLRSGMKHRKHYADYLRRDWDARHRGEWQIEKIEIIYMMERTLPDYTTAPVEKLQLFEGSFESEVREGEGFEKLFGPRKKH